ncbi:hypothetical protein E2C01_015947 [Portunus trituberculatus]|uniref:Uncharacterized protein n=1 Tax=Portunus trituberculatus TaxID=210409 RepID=A0A5B7DN98_PORTR|nr:hypothetical protein [Portunus trituberculatus]
MHNFAFLSVTSGWPRRPERSEGHRGFQSVSSGLQVERCLVLPSVLRQAFQGAEQQVEGYCLASFACSDS